MCVKANLSDLIELRNAYIDVIDNTEDMSTTVRWIYGMHPTDVMIENYINNGEMHIIKIDNKIAGMMAVSMCQGEAYESVNWQQNLKNDEVSVIHILAVTPAYQKKGIAKQLIAYAEKIAGEAGKKAVRLDALDTNTKARKMYEAAGYTLCGISQMHADNLGIADFYMYEKIL